MNPCLFIIENQLIHIKQALTQPVIGLKQREKADNHIIFRPIN